MILSQMKKDRVLFILKDVEFVAVDCDYVPITQSYNRPVISARV